MTQEERLILLRQSVSDAASIARHPSSQGWRHQYLIGEVIGRATAVAIIDGKLVDEVMVELTGRTIRDFEAEASQSNAASHA